jgi:hypothetical protein
LELLQQFYIKLDDLSVEYCLFVGDLHKYCLHCTRCHRAITRPDHIFEILEIAPMAMLWHLGMASDLGDVPHCPVILPSQDFAYYSHSFFEGSMEDIKDIEQSPFSKCDAIMSQGMRTFCEATKVDLQSSMNSMKNQDTTHNTTMVNTLSLITSLFSDVMNVDVAVQSGFRSCWSKMKRTNIAPQDSVIWNRGKSNKKKYFIREHTRYNPADDSTFNFDQLRLYEGWCAFLHNEYAKNILCVLEAISRKVYGPNDTIPSRYLKGFRLDHKDIKSLVERRAENKCFTQLYRFNLCSSDTEDMIIGEGIGSRPIQFSLGKLHTMSSIIEKQGTGWDKINAKEFFKCSEVYRREDVNMSTTKEYEECNIMFSTMYSIRIILKNKEKKDESKIERTFEIQCITDKYQVSNHSLRANHPGMFKEKYFYFFPTNDLVKSMPYDFVNGLKDGKWTKLDNKWLNGVKKTLKQAVSNSIKDVTFLRKIMKDDLPFTDSNLSNKVNDHIYQVTLDNESQSTFYVNDAQIMDVIGEEGWMKGEFNCICNIASSRIVTLSWGAKKKSRSRSQLSIGDDVIVSNHGTKWEHRAKMIQFLDDGISVLVKWETSLKKEIVYLNDCQKLDVEATPVRKRKAPDFFVPIDAEAAEEIIHEAAPDDRLISTDGQLTNIFYNAENSSKQCAQGAIANLLHMLQCSKEQLDLFWQLANCDVEDLVKQFRQELPKNVKNGVDSIEKCVWILRQKFKFTTTKKLNLKRLTSLTKTLNILKQLKFPVLIGVSSTQSSYNHVVVIWNGIVIDYESMHTYTLTEESLRQVCGTNTTFQKVVSGYGLFPPNDLRKKVTELNGTDWVGITEFYKSDDSTIRRFFL